jgi:hypothetical protein
MTLTLDLAAEFGSFCADGEAAERFRERRVDPLLATADEVVFDSGGVRNANTSFCNALIANLVIRHGTATLRKVRFANCRENVKVLVCAALDLAMGVLSQTPVNAAA